MNRTASSHASTTARHRSACFLVLLCLLAGSTAYVVRARRVTAGDAPPTPPLSIKGDGTTDDTAAIQAGLNALADKGGTLTLPPGRYLVKGSVTVPDGVSLEGSAHAPRYNHPLTGTVILATGGRDHEDAPALFEMGDSTTVTNLTVHYPEQKASDIHPYAWTFHLKGCDNTVENVTLINSYNGIRVGDCREGNVRHRIRSVYGCVLRRGIYVDGCSDVGRIENVHFHGHWWWAKEVGGAPDEPGGRLGLVNRYLRDHLEAFVIGRSDWEYITNTFVFIAKTGYRFIKTPAGAGSCQMVGVGADAVHASVVVDGIVSWWTLLITNGQFASDGADPTAVGVQINRNADPAANGSVRLVNCSILAPQGVVSHNPKVTSLQDCYLNTWGPTTNHPLVQADAGTLQVSGCNFEHDRGAPGPASPCIEIARPLSYAMISGNVGQAGVTIINKGVPEKNVVTANNQPAAPG